MPRMPPSDLPADEKKTVTGRYSLGQLSAAFAKLTGASDASAGSGSPKDSELDEASISASPSEELSPRRIVEGMLFVGTAGSLSSRAMAAHIRDVSPQEIDQIICQLNDDYHRQGVAYRIVSEGAGYRMQVAPQWESVRERFGGRVREAKLTPSAIEVLSIVAYRQPVTATQINQLRDTRSGRILSHLVRRELLRLHRPEGAGQRAQYHTTDRFNRLFRIRSPKDLPSSEDLEDG